MKPGEVVRAKWCPPEGWEMDVTLTEDDRRGYRGLIERGLMTWQVDSSGQHARGMTSYTTEAGGFRSEWLTVPVGELGK